jgi:hypothetical protein
MKRTSEVIATREGTGPSLLLPTIGGRFIRQDNDTATISGHLFEATRFRKWVQKQVIELELVPTSTHEPNGGIERAGQEVITRAIKMRTAAFLPARNDRSSNPALQHQPVKSSQPANTKRGFPRLVPTVVQMVQSHVRQQPVRRSTAQLE